MTRRLAMSLVPLLAAACVTTRTTSRTWGEPGAPPPRERHGQVAWVRETVQRQEGNPVGGAAVGAVVGGVLGHALTGRTGGTLVGAAGGAAVGASASQGSAEQASYEVAVRFDDGEQRVYRFNGGTPFAVGQRVRLGPRGLRPEGGPPGRGPGPPPDAPPAYTPPPPPPPPPP